MRDNSGEILLLISLIFFAISLSLYFVSKNKQDLFILKICMALFFVWFVVQVIVYATSQEDKHLYCNEKVKREMQLKKKKQKLFKESIIPKDLYLSTHIKLSCVPDLISPYTEDYNIYIYNNISARKYLEDNWGSNMAEIFDKLEMGAHKIDLWRYCILYDRGGVYLDIKVMPLFDLSTIFSSSNTWYTCISIIPNSFFNAIIATPKENKILFECIEKIIESSKAQLSQDYLLFCKQMQEISKNIYQPDLSESGTYVAKDKENYFDLCLFKEERVNDKSIKPDRYNERTFVYNYKNECVFKARECNYPWKTLPPFRKSILSIKKIQYVNLN